LRWAIEGRLWANNYLPDAALSGLTTHNHLVMFSPMAVIANHVFKALADPTRRAIFEGLARDGEQTVHALTRRAGVSQPAVSKHLVILKRARLVGHRRAGRETHYSARPQALAPLVDWMAVYGAFWQDRFDRLEDLLKGMDQ
jgi:DNA-binding transcriptional ArsR family regulator